MKLPPPLHWVLSARDGPHGQSLRLHPQPPLHPDADAASHTRAPVSYTHLFRPLDNLARRTRQPQGLARSALPVALCVLGLGAATAAQAFEYGPFSLTGFAKVSLGYVSNGCEDCQRDTSASRHFIWTDDLVFGKEFGGLATDSVQIQPTLGVKFDLPKGFTISGAYSQRYRDGKVDLPGVVYERSATLKHEYYGTVQIGNFTSRGWNRPDFPYASDLGQTAFSDAGAAYGILTKACLLYTSRCV